MHKRVIKIGGSLLTTSRLGQRVDQWCTSQSPAINLVIVGGGAVVDSIRELASIHDYDETLLHWLCIDLLETTFRIVSAQMPQWQALRDWHEVDEFLVGSHRASRGTALVRVGAFYSRELEASQSCDLPHSWDTTSDSLAALLARRIGAEELVLLKSCELPQEEGLSEADCDRLSKLGVVDRAFPAAIKGIRNVRCANL